MAKTNAQMLNDINTLLVLYMTTGNRQVLTQIRGIVTKLLRKTPTMVHVVEEAFNDNQLSINILSPRLP